MVKKIITYKEFMHLSREDVLEELTSRDEESPVYKELLRLIGMYKMFTTPKSESLIDALSIFRIETEIEKIAIEECYNVRRG